MIKHPAAYNEKLIPIFKNLIVDYGINYNCESKVLDPFAGTGKIHELPFDTYGIEIEPEWASLHPLTICGDSTKMPFSDKFFDVICTSPTYGNRMADSHTAKDKSHRNTYTHSLGRKLNKNNSGYMYFGDSYKSLHEKVYRECLRVTKPLGLFILNMKNHIRGGKEVDVTSWHKTVLVSMGFDFIKSESVELSGNRFGSNGNVRTPFEYVLLFRKAKVN
jgi:tRNA G10  N-methylase Trm11